MLNDRCDGEDGKGHLVGEGILGGMPLIDLLLLRKARLLIGSSGMQAIAGEKFQDGGAIWSVLFSLVLLLLESGDDEDAGAAIIPRNRVMDDSVLSLVRLDMSVISPEVSD